MTIPDFELFGVGRWNGETWTEADLDEMVANFPLTSHAIRAPVKLGHSNAQILAGQSDGDPALGWITSVKRQGAKLLATLSGVPAKLADLIRKRRYNNVSVEFYRDFAKTEAEQNLQTGAKGRVLCGVALLGADAPAVKTLDQLADFLACDATTIERVHCTDATAVECATYSHDVLETNADSGVTYTRLERGGVLQRAAFAPGPISDARGSHAPSPSTPAGAKDKTMPDDIKHPDPTAAQFAALEARLDALAKTVETQAQTLAAKDAEIVALKADAAQLQKDAAEARAREIAQAAVARHIGAENWVAKYSEAGNLRILPSQRALMTVLRERLMGLDETVPAAQLTACFAATEPATDLTLADILERIVQAMPDQKVLLREVTQAAPPSGETLDSYIEARAKELGKNAKDPGVRRELSLLAASEKPDLVNAALTPVRAA